MRSFWRDGWWLGSGVGGRDRRKWMELEMSRVSKAP